jgi:nicotinamidase-related amidase
MTDAQQWAYPPTRPLQLPRGEIMALTTLDPNKALINVDLPLIHPIDDVIRGTLAYAFRERAPTVVLVNVAGGASGRTEQSRPTIPRQSGSTDPIPELDQRPSDIVATKQTWGAFASTDLEAQLKARAVNQVVIAGMAIGVEATARLADEQGFNVTFAHVAMTDRRLQPHDYDIKNVFPRLGETGTTQEIINLLPARGT